MSKTYATNQAGSTARIADTLDEIARVLHKILEALNAPKS